MRGDRGELPPRELEDDVRAACRGDRSALDRLVRHVEPALREHVERQMGPRARRLAQAQEISNAVLTEVLGATHLLGSEDDLGAIRGRLLRRADWRIQDLVRNHRHVVGESAVGEGLDGLLDDVSSTGSVTRADALRWLTRWVERLPPRYRDVVGPIVFEHVTFAEVARRLGLAEDTARKRYERARNALRERLAGGSRG